MKSERIPTPPVRGPDLIAKEIHCVPEVRIVICLSRKFPLSRNQRRGHMPCGFGIRPSEMLLQCELLLLRYRLTELTSAHLTNS
jgi:hypothetical protein